MGRFSDQAERAVNPVEMYLKFYKDAKAPGLVDTKTKEVYPFNGLMLCEVLYSFSGYLAPTKETINSNRIQSFNKDKMRVFKGKTLIAEGTYVECKAAAKAAGAKHTTHLYGLMRIGKDLKQVAIDLAGSSMQAFIEFETAQKAKKASIFDDVLIVGSYKEEVGPGGKYSVPVFATQKRDVPKDVLSTAKNYEAAVNAYFLNRVTAEESEPERTYTDEDFAKIREANEAAHAKTEAPAAPENKGFREALNEKIDAQTASIEAEDFEDLPF